MVKFYNVKLHELVLVLTKCFVPIKKFLRICALWFPHSVMYSFHRFSSLTAKYSCGTGSYCPRNMSGLINHISFIWQFLSFNSRLKLPSASVASTPQYVFAIWRLGKSSIIFILLLFWSLFLSIVEDFWQSQHTYKYILLYWWGTPLPVKINLKKFKILHNL